MIIKLTNMSEGHEGNPLLINARHIISVFETTRDVPGKKKTIENVTNIYTIIQQSWQVKETLDQIYKMINGGSSKVCGSKCHE
jgi:hypothetical protein